jgi:hypothetical protein
VTPPPSDSTTDESVIEEPAVYICDRCGHLVLSVHCKILCRNCGFMRDCSDP